MGWVKLDDEQYVIAEDVRAIDGAGTDTVTVTYRVGEASVTMTVIAKDAQDVFDAVQEGLR